MKHYRLSEDRQKNRHTDPNTYRVASVLKTIFYPAAEMAHQYTAFEYNAF